ncbi:MFS transporter [Streptomyces mirabilis]|uniref:MFS transporter n=1 Tax=Streptomyces mirabilis TaxID=68239 RepID=UPI0034010434
MSSTTLRPQAQAGAERKNVALFLLAMTQFLIMIDGSIVNVALPAIGRGLHISNENLSWVVNGYTLTFAGFLLLGGRVADLVGRRRMLILGLAVFVATSLLGGLAQNDAWLIAARAGQGIGAAIASPAALSIITTMFTEGAERNRALGVWGAVAGVGGAAGVLLGGALTQYLDWRWILFVNVPLGAVVIAFAPRFLKESRSDHPGSFDLVGAGLITGGLALLVYAFVNATSVGWGSTQTIWELAGAVLLLALFVVVELRERSPLIPFSIFRMQTLRGANVVGLLIGMPLLAMFYFISLYLQDVRGYSAIMTGIGYLPLAVMIVIAAGVGQALVTKVGYKATLALGTFCLALALAWFSRLSATGTYASDILGPSILAGLGFGLSFVSVTVAAVTSGTKDHHAGLASGLINTVQQVGGALGLGVLASIASSATKSSHAPSQAVALTHGFSHGFLIAAIIAIIATLLTLLLISNRDSREHARAAQRGQVPVVV